MKVELIFLSRRKIYCKIYSMVDVINKMMSVSSVVLLAVFALGAHLTPVSSQTAIAMGDMTHPNNTSSSMNCIASCTSATVHNDTYLDNIEKNNDKQTPPFYIQFRASPILEIANRHTHETLLAMVREPPPGGSPAYIALTVFRV
jgi:hypothetical protein